MPERVIYIREQDEELWQKAEELVGKESLSAFVAEALKKLIATKEHRDDSVAAHQWRLEQARRLIRSAGLDYVE